MTMLAPNRYAGHRSRDHQPRDLALFPLPAEPAHGRGDAGRPRHRRQSRDGAAVGAEVWPGVRERDPAAPATARRTASPLITGASDSMSRRPGCDAFTSTPGMPTIPRTN